MFSFFLISAASIPGEKSLVKPNSNKNMVSANKIIGWYINYLKFLSFFLFLQQVSWTPSMILSRTKMDFYTCVITVRKHLDEQFVNCCFIINCYVYCCKSVKYILCQWTCVLHGILFHESQMKLKNVMTLNVLDYGLD